MATGEDPVYTQQGSLFRSLLTANAMTLVSRQIKQRKKDKAHPPLKLEPPKRAQSSVGCSSINGYFIL